MKPKDNWCYYCKHSGKRFNIHKMGHIHCEHPDEEIRGEAGWGSLREIWETCEEFKHKQMLEVAIEKTKDLKSNWTSQREALKQQNKELLEFVKRGSINICRCDFDLKNKKVTCYECQRTQLIDKYDS